MALVSRSAWCVLVLRMFPLEDFVKFVVYLRDSMKSSNSRRRKPDGGIFSGRRKMFPPSRK